MAEVILDQVTREFAQNLALDRISLTVPDESFVVLLGPNGAGKTTFFNLLSGNLNPTAGRVFFKGEDITRLPVHKTAHLGIGRSFQITNIFPKMTVFENVRCALLWSLGYKYSFWNMVSRSRELNEGAERILEQINLTERRDLPAGVLAYAVGDSGPLSLLLGTTALAIVLRNTVNLPLAVLASVAVGGLTGLAMLALGYFGLGNIIRFIPYSVMGGFLAATGYLLGSTQSKEYAEPEWYIDIWLTIVWVAFLLVFLGTLFKRKEKHIYVANWFLLSFIVTVAMLHLVNNISIPVSIWGSKSVQLFSGVQDAMTQWWYGHNAVGFFLTAGFLGMMYYFVPKQAGRPVFSYKLSIIHFWALIFLYIWAGPHHLHYTALPDWASTLGMVFSIILWMPSWGGMINGLMTLQGAWDKLRTDPIIRMMVISLAFYGMSTFEGPMMSIRAVNSLSHYTDWTIGHVHSGALGWNGMITFGMLYYLVPKLWGKERLYSLRMVSWHYWLATIGIVLYAASMWVTGIMEGLMWREVDAQGFLVNSFADTVAAKFPMYVVRGLGGTMFLGGALIMSYNLWMTVRKGTAKADSTVAAPAE